MTDTTTTQEATTTEATGISLEQHIRLNGALLQLSISVWTGTKKMKDSEMRDLTADGEKADPEYIKGMKRLISKEWLDPMSKKAGEVRNAMRALALPFPLDGFIFIPKRLVSAANEFLIRSKAEFNEILDQKIPSYDAWRAQAMASLKRYGHEDDYPIDLRSKFKFTWRFLSLDTADPSVLDPQTYAEEERKFRETMEQARDEAVTALRVQLRDLIHHAVERLTPAPDGKKKIFRDTLIENFTDFFETVTARNIFGDTELERIGAMAKAVINGTDPEDLRKNDYLALKIKSDLEPIMAEIDKAVIEAPTRRIRL
jgi:hypothetical protein